MIFGLTEKYWIGSRLTALFKLFSYIRSPKNAEKLAVLLSIFMATEDTDTQTSRGLPLQITKEMIRWLAHQDYAIDDMNYTVSCLDIWHNYGGILHFKSPITINWNWRTFERFDFTEFS